MLPTVTFGIPACKKQISIVVLSIIAIFEGGTGGPHHRESRGGREEYHGWGGEGGPGIAAPHMHARCFVHDGSSLRHEVNLHGLARGRVNEMGPITIAR